MNHSKANSEKRAGFLAVLVFFISLNVMSGCARDSKTIRTDTVNGTPTQTVVVEEHTTDTRDRGVLGSTFHVIGEILAFPFEVIAGAFRFIF